MDIPFILSCCETAPSYFRKNPFPSLPFMLIHFFLSTSYQTTLYTLSCIYLIIRRFWLLRQQIRTLIPLKAPSSGRSLPFRNSRTPTSPLLINLIKSKINYKNSVPSVNKQNSHLNATHNLFKSDKYPNYPSLTLRNRSWHQLLRTSLIGIKQQKR